MDRVQIDYKGYKMTDEVFKPRTCKETEVIEMHTKKKPECKKVTKQNCVTKWVVKPSGQKVCNSCADHVILTGHQMTNLGSNFEYFFRFFFSRH